MSLLVSRLSTPVTPPSGWLGPLSKAPTILPLAVVASGWLPSPPITPAVAAPATGWMSPLSVAQSSPVTVRGLATVPLTPPLFISFAWQQPLSVAPRQAQASLAFATVPLYVAPVAPAAVNMGWYAQLAKAPVAARFAPQAMAIEPWTVQASVSTTGKRRPTLFLSNVGRLMGP